MEFQFARVTSFDSVEQSGFATILDNEGNDTSLTVTINYSACRFTGVVRSMSHSDVVFCGKVRRNAAGRLVRPCLPKVDDTIAFVGTGSPHSNTIEAGAWCVSSICTESLRRLARHNPCPVRHMFPATYPRKVVIA